MSSVPNANFVSFLKAYGPWADNNMLFEEHVRHTAQSKNIQPFEYATPFKTSIEPIQRVLEAQRSQLVFICGRAGDGKTHLLGQLFEHEELLNLGSEKFKEVTFTEKTPSSFMEFDDVRGFKLSVVSDLSQVEAFSKDEQQLFLNVFQALEAFEQESLQASEPTSPQLVLIAGNNGMILDKINNMIHLLSELVESNVESVAGEIDRELAGKISGEIAGEIAGDIIGEITGDIAGEITGKMTGEIAGEIAGDIAGESAGKISGEIAGDIAGNITGAGEIAIGNTKHISFLSDLWTKERCLALKTKLEDIREGLKRTFIEQQIFKSDCVTLVNLSNRVNAEVMQEILDTMLKHESWSKCSDCDCFKVCPIYRNREILSYPWLQQRLINVLHLLKADGFPITIRTAQSLVVNGLLGCGFEKDSKQNDMNCFKVQTNFRANQGECNIESNVYDNLLGLNLNEGLRLERDIFKALHNLRLGECTSKIIDNFLLKNIVSSPSLTSNSLASLYAQLKESFINNFDLYGLNQDLAEIWEFISKKEQKFVEGNGNGQLSYDYQAKFSAKLKDLRRLLFFTIGAPLIELKHRSVSEFLANENLSREEIQKSIRNNMFFDPFLMTKYPHANAYFEIEALLDNHCSCDVIGANKSAKSLILALNRLFTGLYTSQANSYLYVPASNLSNMSLLYSDKIFLIKAYSERDDSSINLVKLPDYAVPVLQFRDRQQPEYARVNHAFVNNVEGYTNGDTNGAFNGEAKGDKAAVNTAVLVLTPYLFECLMQIADGVSGLCLPEQALYELRVFKDKILSLLEVHFSSHSGDTFAKTLLSSIQRLEINSQGQVALSENL